MKARVFTTIAFAAVLAAVSFGQDHNRSRHTTTTRSTHTVTRQSSGAQRGHQVQRTTRTVQTTRSNYNRGNANVDRNRTIINNNRTVINHDRTFTNGRPNRFVGSGGGGQHFRPMDWRRDHAGWDGHMYYHEGRYYFDPGFTIVADLDNEWNSIAAISGGVSLLGALENDPYLVFAGDVGEMYAFSTYNTDLYSTDPSIRLRAEFFARPYFWRDGVRYDRHIVEENGHRFYQFRRH